MDQIGITVAQRYSVLVTARDDTDFNWVIHADMDTSMFNTVNPGLNPSRSYLWHNSSSNYFDTPIKSLRYNFIDYLCSQRPAEEPRHR